MRFPILETVIFCIAALPGTGHALQQSSLDSTFTTLIGIRNTAIAQGDTAQLHRLLAEDVRYVIGTTGEVVTGPQLIAAVTASRAAQSSVEIDSVRTRSLGSVITASYQRRDHYRFGTSELVTRSEALDVFALRRGRWLLIEHTQTLRSASPNAISLDSAALDAYVGRYELAPGYVDQVTRVGDHLVATATGEPTGATLTPVSPTVFRPTGVSTVTIFERDPAGKVVGYVSHLPDGQALRARRVE